MAVESVSFTPHAGQIRVLQSKKRFIFALAGQRSGKSHVGAYWLYLQAQEPNTNHLIAANTIDQLNMSTVSKFLEEFPQISKYYVKKEKTFYLPNKARIFCRSMEIPDHIKGMNLHSIWADEIDGMSQYAWEVMRSRVATTNGKILGTSSIYANSWLTDYVQFKRDPDYEIITWPSNLNPAFPKEEYDKLKREMNPVDFDREYGGEFSFAGGKVYGGLFEYGLISYVESKPLALYFGVDFGVNDPTAISVLTYNDDGCWYLIDEYYAPKMSIQEINHWLEHFVDKYGRPRQTLIDPAGGVARLSLTPRCNPADATKSIEKRVMLVRDLIHQKRFFCLKKCINAIREFQRYSFSNKQNSIDEPVDKDNHMMDSFGMVLENVHTHVDGIRLKKEEEREESHIEQFWGRKKENYHKFEEYFDE